MACAWIVLLVMMLSRRVPHYCRQARVARHRALLGPFLVQTVQKVLQFLGNDRCRFWPGQCSALPVETPQAQFLDQVVVFTTGFIVQTVQTVWLQLIFKDVDIGAEADPRGPDEIPQLPYSWWSMSLLCSSASLRGAESFSHGPHGSSDHRDSPVATVFRSCRLFASLLRRRVGFPWSRLSSDHRDSPFA